MNERKENPQKYIKVSTLDTSSSYVRRVAEHYNLTEGIGRVNRRQSRIIQLRNFNNGIKSCLITELVDFINTKWPNYRPLNVLDIACGKGGDLYKWKLQNIGKLVCTDIAEVSLDECRQRYEEMKLRFGKKLFNCEFIHADSTTDILRSKYSDPNIEFDIVSCQFALHYSFESYKQLTVMFQNISECLKVGGYFIGTLPNSYEIMKRITKSENNRFGNEFFEVSINDYDPNEAPLPLFGAKYNFKLIEAVNCPEFLVYFPVLVEIAKYFHLRLVFVTPFDHYFYSRLCKRYGNNFKSNTLTIFSNNIEKLSKKPDLDHIFKYLSDKSHSDVKKIGSCSKSIWDAITIYNVFAFEKISS